MVDSLLPRVREFLAEDPIPHFIGGSTAPSRDGATMDVLNPSDGCRLARVSLAGASEVDDAAKSAAGAFEIWAAMDPVERAVILHRWADLIEKHSGELAQIESLDVGKPITASESFDIPFGNEGLRYFADLSQHVQYRQPLAIRNMEAYVHRSPCGVCGFIFPWNFPFDLLMWGVGPALAAGNTVVVKPSEVTPLSTLYSARLAAEAGFPAGVFNVVVGEGHTAGAALTAHPVIRRMSFTGSPEVGAKVAEACGRRVIPCKLELGGKGAAVVLNDAEVQTAAEKLASALALNCGQVCCTATRWLVDESVADEFLEAAVQALRAIAIGPALDRSTAMGPLVSEKQRERVLGYYEKGLRGGAAIRLEPADLRDRPGFYVSPWILEGGPDNVCFREEIFGPAACLTRFRGQDHAVDLVNHLDYGLANSVWSSDLNRARSVAEKLVAGNAWINAHNVFAYGLPYGGVNRSGMGGGVNSPQTLMDYLREQTVARPL